MSSYKNSKPEEYARWRRRDHANIEAIQNLVIARVAEESGVGKGTTNELFFTINDPDDGAR